jgi:3-keto-5-aminohexanoate cleavage enzyme
MGDKVWVEVAVNGAFGRKLQPNIPVSVDEIVADGVACVKAGASIVHVHPYDETTGRQKDDADIYARIIEGIREQVDAIVYPTVTITGGAAARFAPIEELARRGLLEWAAVDPGSVNITLFDQVATDKDGILYVNSEEHLRAGLGMCARHGVHPSYAIYEPGFVRNGKAWADHLPQIPAPIYRLMLSDGFTFGFPPREYALDAYTHLLDEVAPGAPRMIAGLMVDVMELAGYAIEKGYHLRTGLEDLPMGCVATNVQLVETAVAQVTKAGREPATAADVRASF